MGSTASVLSQWRPSSLGAYFSKRRAQHRLAQLRAWDRNFFAVFGLLREQALVREEELAKRLHPLRKRLQKASKRLVNDLPNLERSLIEAADNRSYLADLRRRLVEARDKCQKSTHGLQPSEEVEEGLRALEDGNPYASSYSSLAAQVADVVERHKKGELSWLEAQIKKCTGWLKTIDRLTRKMTACVEIGSELQGQVVALSAQASGAAAATREQLAALDEELGRVEAVLRRLNSERQRIETAAAFATALLSSRDGGSGGGSGDGGSGGCISFVGGGGGGGNHLASSAAILIDDESSDADISLAQRRWRWAIRAVVFNLRAKKKGKGHTSDSRAIVPTQGGTSLTMSMDSTASLSLARSSARDHAV